MHCRFTWTVYLLGALLVHMASAVTRCTADAHASAITRCTVGAHGQCCDSLCIMETCLSQVVRYTIGAHGQCKVWSSNGRRYRQPTWCSWSHVRFLPRLQICTSEVLYSLCDHGMDFTHQGWIYHIVLTFLCHTLHLKPNRLVCTKYRSKGQDRFCIVFDQVVTSDKSSISFH